MAIDFSKIKLELVDININAKPEMFINKNNISFSKKVLEDLNYPANVQFCMDAKNRVFAIRPCKGNEARAAVFSKPKSEQVSMLSITNKNLKDTISLLIPDFDDSLKYTVVGEFDMENRIMYYDMSTAEASSMRASRKDVE